MICKLLFNPYYRKETLQNDFYTMKNRVIPISMASKVHIKHYLILKI